MKRILTQLSPLFASLALGACASITALQTAKTLPAGEMSHTVAAGYSNLKLNRSNATASARVPNVDYMFRYGATDKDEVGLRIASGVYGAVDYKRGLITDGPFLLSVGLGIGGTSYEIGAGAGSSKHTIVDFYIPLYADYWVTDTFGLFVSPKYIPRLAFGTGGTQSDHLAGVSGGFKWGGDVALLAEVGYARQLTHGGVNLWQVMAGVAF